MNKKNICYIDCVELLRKIDKKEKEIKHHIRLLRHLEKRLKERKQYLTDEQTQRLNNVEFYV